MATCPADCAVELTPYDGNCTSTPRLKTPARLGFYECSTSLPDPLTAEGIEALLTSNEIVFSPDLSTFTANDPEIQEIPVSDCTPSLRRVSSREFTFQDRNGYIGSAGSPAAPVPYADYDFWLNKVTNARRLNVLVQYCDGDTVIALDENGNPLTVDLFGFINWDTPTTAGSPRPEIKQFSLRFNGDPMAFYNKPKFNVNQSTGEVTLL